MQEASDWVTHTTLPHTIHTQANEAARAIEREQPHQRLRFVAAMVAPIHQAAWDGDVAAIDRLVAEDGERLNALIQGDLRIGALHFRGCTPLMVAAYRGQYAAVARLLASGADVGLQSRGGSIATHSLGVLRRPVIFFGSAAQCRCLDGCARP